MNPTIQSGTHPDAESLTAFAEQLLPAAEREQVLAHMSTCSRCREVVFLAQQAEDPTTLRVQATEAKKPRASWFSGWRWAWLPVAALAGFTGVAVVQHFRHAEPEPQMTAKLSPTDALRKTEPAKSAPAITQPASLPQAELHKTKPAVPSEARDGSLHQADKDEEKQLDQKKSVNQNELAAVSGVTSSPGISGGSVHGMMAARAKSPAIGGPMAANQFQQNQLQQSLDQQNLAQLNLTKPKPLPQLQSTATDAANKPRFAGPAPASAAQTVSVEAETMELTPTPAPAAAPQISPMPLTGKNYAALSAGSAAKRKVQKITLPNGLGVLSVASEAGRSIALDTAGAMFLSEDDSKHWQPIPSQWTGRAMFVRTRPVAALHGALGELQTVRFELVNDKLQTWVSFDGKTWTAQSLPLQ